MYPYKTSVKVENNKIIYIDHHTKAVTTKELAANLTKEQVFNEVESFSKEMHIQLMQTTFSYLKTFKKG
jgi:hypothetical protein